MHLRRTILSPYHYLWALGSAVWYGFPAHHMTVIAVTGTKGKSSVAEMLYTILTEAGHVTALSSTIHFANGKEMQPNRTKMGLPGRGFVQKFLAQARHNRCTHAVIEISSEAALQHRHLGLELNAVVFTNLHKEHFESHGSMENYFQAKYRLATALLRSPKRPRAIIANSEDEYGKRFLATQVEQCIPFSFADTTETRIDETGVSFSYSGVQFSVPQPGRFSVMNALAAIKTAEFLGIAPGVSARALSSLALIRGRAERIDSGRGFVAVVDYAHTPDSLRALYDAFPDRRKICILGNTGGGRDTWKRPEMARIAEQSCDTVILTNEDPYDEAPEKIVAEMAVGMKEKKPMIIMDRREAIRAALRAALPGDAVLISGKGTDPYIMGPRGEKTLWDDATVVREELKKLP